MEAPVEGLPFQDMDYKHLVSCCTRPLWPQWCVPADASMSISFAGIDRIWGY
jgi:uncharacterized membrane protein